MRWKKFRNFKFFTFVLLFCIVFIGVLVVATSISGLTTTSSSSPFNSNSINNNDNKNTINKLQQPTKDSAATNDELGLDENNINSLLLKRNKNVDTAQQLLYGDLPCLINGERSLTCLRDNNDEIYVPFKSFLQKYYEVTGFVSRKSDGEEIFEWWHSTAKIHKPTFEKYDPRGVFGSFATYNVEHRDRVKCISGIDGVPLSTQWQSTPYYYPVQIAQFALEHYSKNLTEQPPFVVMYENGELKSGTEIWHTPPEAVKQTVLERLIDKEQNSNVLHFKTPPSIENPGIFINLETNSSKLYIIRFFIKFIDESSSFTITVERMDTRSFYYIHYIQTDEHLRTAEPNQIFIGIGRSNSSKNNYWRRITRNVLIDFTKSLMVLVGAKKQKRLKLAPEHVRFVSLSFRGEAYLDDLSQQSSAHNDHFFDGANWLLAHQDERGGLPITVRRSFSGAESSKLSLEPNWYSAMAQGHAMSTLCRAFYTTQDQKYKTAALKAAGLFNISSYQGGVRNFFFSTYPWYEEYPTIPGTFVLNGFIYSLIGLYDALNLCDSTDVGLKKLYTDGLTSLKKLLPLFDTGSGSIYDLKHVSLGTPPNVARWDYHSVHIYQLYWLYSIERDELFKTTADRWQSYAKGVRVKQH